MPSFKGTLSVAWGSQRKNLVFDILLVIQRYAFCRCHRAADMQVL